MTPVGPEAAVKFVSDQAKPPTVRVARLTSVTLVVALIWNRKALPLRFLTTLSRAPRRRW